MSAKLNEKKEGAMVEKTKVVIFFVNGMLTGPREASLDALQLSEFLGMKVHTIYNPTHGIFLDCLQNLWLYFFGKNAVVTLASEEIKKVANSGSVIVVTIAHGQGALVMKRAVKLLLKEHRSKLGIVAMASPVMVESNLGTLFVENIAVSKDIIPKLSRLKGCKEAKMPTLDLSYEKRFEQSFLAGNYQKSGWPRLKEILEKLKEPA